MVIKRIPANPAPRPKRVITIPWLDRGIRVYKRLESFVRRHVGLPPTPWAWNERALAAFQRGDFDSAIECATLAIARDRYYWVSYHNRAAAHRAKGEPASAIEDLQQLVRLVPESAEGWNLRGTNFLELGRFDEAIADFSRAISRDDRNAMFLANRGCAYFLNGDEGKASADWERALKMAPNAKDVYRAKANCFYGAGRMDESLVEYEKLVDSGSADASDIAMRGYIHFARKNYVSAIRDFTMAIERDPSQATVWRARGHARYEIGEFQQAIDDTTECLSRAPSDGIAYNNRGLFHAKIGSYSQAVADLRKAIEVLPALPNSFKNLAWLQATCPDPDYRDGAQAVKNALQAWEMSKDRQLVWMEIIAAAHAEAGNFDEAIAVQKKYLQDPDVKNSEAAAKRFALYESRLAFRDSPATPAITSDQS